MALAINDLGSIQSVGTILRQIIWKNVLEMVLHLQGSGTHLQEFSALLDMLIIL